MRHDMLMNSPRSKQGETLSRELCSLKLGQDPISAVLSQLGHSFRAGQNLLVLDTLPRAFGGAFLSGTQFA
jgi:hypothetical protein